MKREPEEAQARWAEWVGLSHRVEPFHPYLPVVVQSLGRKDRDLWKREAEYSAAVASSTDEPLDWTLDDLWLDSNMYVLYAYEIVRQITEAVRDDSKHAALKGTETEAFINDCKRQLNRYVYRSRSFKGLAAKPPTTESRTLTSRSPAASPGRLRPASLSRVEGCRTYSATRFGPCPRDTASTLSTDSALTKAAAIAAASPARTSRVNSSPSAVCERFAKPRVVGSVTLGCAHCEREPRADD
jgi:hypothetical protein